MTPQETGKNYDQVAAWWLDQMKDSTAGLTALNRALRLMPRKGAALDVGCGCEGRFLRVLSDEGFECTGMDVSPAMVALATARFPNMRFETADICNWIVPSSYDFISAWDSTFHLPLES